MARDKMAVKYKFSILKLNFLLTEKKNNAMENLKRGNEDVSLAITFLCKYVNINIYIRLVCVYPKTLKRLENKKKRWHENNI